MCGIQVTVVDKHQESRMAANEDTQTPSEIVAYKTMERFIEKKLLTDELALEIVARVGSGRMQPADWKLTFEKSVGLHKAS
jgi:hypothetical protein